MNKMLLEGEEMLIFKQVRLLGKIITNNALLSYLKTHSYFSEENPLIYLWLNLKGVITQRILIRGYWNLKLNVEYE